MDKILYAQSKLQDTYANMEGYPLLNPRKFEDYTVGEVYDFIRQMKFCINEELTELMEAIGDGTRAIHKPWSEKYFDLRNMAMCSTQGAREEGIDALCFLMNILLVVGITPGTIHYEYKRVLMKNAGRIREYNEAHGKTGESSGSISGETCERRRRNVSQMASRGEKGGSRQDSHFTSDRDGVRRSEANRGQGDTIAKAYDRKNQKGRRRSVSCDGD